MVLRIQFENKNKIFHDKIKVDKVSRFVKNKEVTFFVSVLEKNTRKPLKERKVSTKYNKIKKK